MIGKDIQNHSIHYSPCALHSRNGGKPNMFYPQRQIASWPCCSMDRYAFYSSPV